MYSSKSSHKPSKMTAMSPNVPMMSRRYSFTTNYADVLSPGVSNTKKSNKKRSLTQTALKPIQQSRKKLSAIHPFLNHFNHWLSNEYLRQNGVNYDDSKFWSTIVELNICQDEDLHSEIGEDANAVFGELIVHCFTFDSERYTNDDVIEILQCIYDLVNEAFPIEESTNYQKQELSESLKHIFEPQKSKKLCEDEEVPSDSEESKTKEEEISDLKDVQIQTIHTDASASVNEITQQTEMMKADKKVDENCLHHECCIIC